ncbi:DUF421 domain-containing protein [Novosphingobium terrae]|uniref:DUF421 domain-containing protein n=1 Tax=Novosphingobium terrae TaxID=2726189 RepID=UPI001981D4CC|nr:YetF domain-containing protein [Novosphingobium terrae]
MEDWLHTILGPDQAPASTAHLCARAVVLFLYGLLCMRIAGRRSFSSLSPFDIFIAIIVGSNISRVMTGGVPFIPCLAATMVVVVMHRLMAMATMRSNWLALFVKGRADVLARDGHVDQAMMRRHDVSPEDLAEALRMQGIDDVKKARLVTFERGGKITAIPRSPAS